MADSTPEESLAMLKLSVYQDRTEGCFLRSLYDQKKSWVDIRGRVRIGDELAAVGASIYGRVRWRLESES